MNRTQLIAELEGIVSSTGVIQSEDELISYECDGLTVDKVRPGLVVVPASVEQIARIVRALDRAGVPFAPWGYGTGLSGGSLIGPEGVLISTARLNRIVEVDLENRFAVAEPGTVNLWLTQAVSDRGYCYVPDPSSQPACTIGGNVAENSGGAHCLKYGVTTNYILGLEVVLADGRTVELGGRTLDTPGYDLVGVLVGSEGTLGIVTKVAVRLNRQPESVRTLLSIFSTIDDAGHAVSGILRTGIIPAALEMMDNVMIQAVEAAVHAGYPTDAGAVLIVEVDGPEAGLDAQVERIQAVCAENGALETRAARDESERLLLWEGRKKAFGAIGRISPNYLVQDGVVPRRKLPEVLAQVGEIGARNDLRIANVFHAGDGNLHPLILFDERDEDQMARAKRASAEILRACVDAGGTISGEHGIGTEKLYAMEWVFGPDDLHAMRALKEVFDPRNLCNPGKILPANGSASASLHSEAEPESERRIEESAEVADLASEDERSKYAVDGMVPKVVAFPEETGQVQEILTRANRDDLSVVPWGGGTKQRLGGIPERADIVLCTSRLNRVMEYSPDDLVVTVGAGLTLSELQMRLSEQNQMLPLDPPHMSKATIGGMLAANDSGPKRLAYGSARDFTLGLKIVGPDGRCLRTGGKVVKNVSGYDMTKLHIGGLGTLGVIVEATFKLLPRPEMSYTLAAGFRDIGAAAEAVRTIQGTSLLPSALELLDSMSAKRLMEDMGRDLPGDVLLLASAEGPEEVVRDQIERMGGLCGEVLGTERIADDQDTCLWEGVRALIGEVPSSDILCKASVLPSHIGEMFRSAEEIGRQHGIDLSSIAHAGSGIAYIRLSDADPEKAPAALSRLRERAVAFGGSLVVYGAPITVKRQIDVWGRSGGDVELMRALRARMDPKGVLNPGRFISRA